MSTAQQGSEQHAATLSPDVVALLLRLGRPHVRLLHNALDGSSTLAERRSGKQTMVDTAIAQAAWKAGLLEADTTAPGAVLSDAGRTALRAALMAAPAKNPASSSLRDKRDAQAAIAARSPERLTIVEQLAKRRDGHGKPLLDTEHVAAALKLAKSFQIGQLQPRVTARWSAEAMQQSGRRGAPGAGVDLTDTAATAIAHFRAALAVIGGNLANVLVDVCCLERGLETVEAERRWPSGTGRIMLREALDRLVEHYGMRPQPQKAQSGSRHWGDESFKPSAAAWTQR